MRWSYKTVHYELKKEGLLGSAFLDESEVEFSFNEYGRAGWELISILETMDGIIAVFKQPLTRDSHSFFHSDPEKDVPDNKQYETTVDATDREIGAAVVENLIVEEVVTEKVVQGVMRDEFEAVEVDSVPEEATEQKAPLSKREVGTIRIE